VPELYLFTWNLNKDQFAHDLAIKHLAQRGSQSLFVACVQELPGRSVLAKARMGSNVDGLTTQGIRVVSKLSPNARGRAAPSGLALASYPALVHHPDLKQIHAVADEDGEFVAACFEMHAPKKTLAVVGLHAKSQVNMKEAEDRGGSRALLRHAINEISLHCDHTIVLGDWNCHWSARETQSWHCFYALHEGFSPLSGPSFTQRRGFDHPPLYVVEPRNVSMGTFQFNDSGTNHAKTIDFIAVDKDSRFNNARSEILTTVAATSVWDPGLAAPSVSDHLPVEGHLQV
jgi:endonuclease/exonuclease/phosphatase family metal-dependent hydrolase